MKKTLKILLVILILLQFLFLGLFGYAFVKKEDGEIALELLHYQNKADFSYQVNLKENEIVDSESLNENSSYILDLIDTIQLSPRYQFQSEEKTKLMGKKTLSTQLTVLYQEPGTDEEQELLNRTETLEEVSFEQDTKEFEESMDYSLNLNSYIDTVERIRDEVSSTVRANLDVCYEIQLDGVIQEQNYDDQYQTCLSIPLSKTSKLEVYENGKEDQIVYDEEKVEITKPMLMVLVACNVMIFFLICLIIKAWLDRRTSEYEKLIQHILKNYGELIIDVKESVNTKEKEVVHIENFREMYELSKNLSLPMMHYVDKNRHVFYITKEKTVYLFLLKEEEVLKNGAKHYL